MVCKNIVVRIEISQIRINSSQETTRDGIQNWKIATKATQAFCYYPLKQIRGLIIWEEVKNRFNTHTDNMITLNKCYMYLNFNPIKTLLESWFGFFFHLDSELRRRKYLQKLQERILKFLEGRCGAYCWLAEWKIGSGQREKPSGTEGLKGGLIVDNRKWRAWKDDK